MARLARLLALIALAFVAACSKPIVWAPEHLVQAARYRHAGPPELVLFNVISRASGQGEHAGLMINAPSERVIYDGAGSWSHPDAPERHDLHHGVTERVLGSYLQFQRGPDSHVVQMLRLPVPPETAELVLRRAQVQGPAPDAHCTLALAAILRAVPGFESLPVTIFPGSFAAAFARLPGVTEVRHPPGADLPARRFER